MRAFFAPETDAHDPHFFLVRGRLVANEERPERARRLLAGLARHAITTEAPPAAETASVLAVHGPRYLQFLEVASRDWSSLQGAGAEAVPNVHPAFDDGPAPSYPASLVGQAGWHMADTACPVGPGSYRAARRAVDTAVAATQAVVAGAPHAYALCRPPGHHATAERAGGHCLLNNAAVAASVLRQHHERVAILDIDVHHGNGTQSIFYDRADVLTVSIHADPTGFYPFFVGHAHETGVGAGEGANVNLPLPLGTANTGWLGAVADGLTRLTAFDPGAVVLSLGLDAHERDPLRGLAVSTPGFEAAGQMIGQAPWPMVLVQEGGYLSPDLTETLDAFLTGFLAQRV
jgi:acetoin utilization deacetylase AcuC-like enzyme